MPVVLAQPHLVEVEAPAQDNCPFLADRGERPIGVLDLLQSSKRDLALMVVDRSDHGRVQRQDDPRAGRALDVSKQQVLGPSV